ncbi:hypothetical protein KY495_05665 [Massilia sp. PAMC28688]|uniref:hypothetical protein n=1 Tax=Massilia sp. PAMC28688 TaxID=2861283 RepID=UPI001C63850D|nr:hypothetical protein [Massilia sp. PAMC28688]QYF94681.1 hypothetical protein KY495_05665 [Massilia sp. PAMC28688]
MKMDEHTDPLLDPPFAALRGAMAGLNAPRGVEKELLDAFARQFPPRRWYHALSPRQWGMAGGVGSTALVAVLALGLSTQVPPPALPAAPAVTVDDGAAFIALASAERIEQEPHARMLETDVPRTALAAIGLPVTPENAGDSVRAEVLVGADGSPLALRLVALP